jgi:hypothetical protein
VRAEAARAHAEFHARESPAGIGAAIVRSGPWDGAHVWEHFWDSVVTDGREWHYLRVLSTGTGPFPNISAEDVEQGIARFAAALPARDRMLQLLNANPLHIDRNRNVTD